MGRKGWDKGGEGSRGGKTERKVATTIFSGNFGKSGIHFEGEGKVVEKNSLAKNGGGVIKFGSSRRAGKVAEKFAIRSEGEDGSPPPRGGTRRQREKKRANYRQVSRNAVGSREEQKERGPRCIRHHGGGKRSPHLKNRKKILRRKDRHAAANYQAQREAGTL